MWKDISIYLVKLFKNLSNVVSIPGISRFYGPCHWNGIMKRRKKLIYCLHCYIINEPLLLHGSYSSVQYEGNNNTCVSYFANNCIRKERESFPFSWLYQCFYWKFWLAYSESKCIWASHTSWTIQPLCSSFQMVWTA